MPLPLDILISAEGQQALLALTATAGALVQLAMVTDSFNSTLSANAVATSQAASTASDFAAIQSQLPGMFEQAAVANGQLVAGLEGAGPAWAQLSEVQATLPGLIEEVDVAMANQARTAQQAAQASQSVSAAGEQVENSGRKMTSSLISTYFAIQQVGAGIAALSPELAPLQGVFQGIAAAATAAMSGNFVAAAAAGIGAATQFIGTISQTAGQFDTDLANMSRSTGMSEQSTLQWQLAMQLAGGTTHEFEQAMNSLQSSMQAARNGAGQDAQAFRDLHVGLKDASGQSKTAAQTFQETVQALAQQTDAAKQDSDAHVLFGRNALALLAVIRDYGPAMSQAAEIAKVYGLSEGEASEKAKEWQDSQLRLKGELIELGNQTLPTVVGAAHIMSMGLHDLAEGWDFLKDHASLFMTVLQTGVPMFGTAVEGAYNLGKALVSSGSDAKATADDYYELLQAMKDVATQGMQMSAVSGQDYGGAGAIGDLGGGIAYARAAGGPVQAGVPYWVGENGPELRVFSEGGTIIPANISRQLSGMGDTDQSTSFYNHGVIVVNKQAQDSSSDLDVLLRSL